MTATIEALAPTWCTLPDWHYTLGPEVAELCDRAGFTPDPNQALILDAAFAVGRDGRPAAFEVAVVAPRQAIKTGVEKMIALGLMYLLERRLVIWSAHEYSTAQEAFRDLQALVEGNDFLDRRTERVLAADGRELIELKGDRRLRFRARTKNVGRGLTGDDTFLDEAFALKAAHMGALLPTMLARRDAQVFYGSSAGLYDSAILRGIRDRGRAGSPRLAYFEWGDEHPGEGCATEDCDHATVREGCALDDVDRLLRINPAISVGRQTVEAVMDLRRALPPEEYARECLGWWDEPAGEDNGLSIDAWNLLGDDAAKPTGDLVFGIDVAAGHAAASVTVVGGGVLELVDRRPAASWLPGRVAELLEEHGGTVAYDPAGPIGWLVPEFLRLGVELVPVEGKDAIRAVGALIAAVDGRSFRHRGEPEFAAAVAGARRRVVGDGHKWSRRDSSVDISPLVSATLALWVAGLGREPLTEEQLLGSFG